MARILGAVVAVLVLTASSAHASVVVSQHSGADGDSVRLDATAVDGADIRVSYDDGIVIDAGDAAVENLTEGCHPLGGAVRCAGDRIEVLLGDGDDRFRATNVWNGSVRAGGGDDVLRAERALSLAYDGGPGHDSLAVTEGESGVYIPAASDGWTAVEDVEHLTTTHISDWVEPDPGQELVLGDGSDTVYARNGTDEVIDCGPGADVGQADAGDRLSGCEHVWQPPGGSSAPFGMGGLPPAFIPPQAGSNLGGNPLGVQGTPKIEGDRVTLRIRAYFVESGDLALTVGPWRGDAPTATLRATLPPDRRMEAYLSFTVRLPPGLLEVARRDGRLRARGELRFRGHNSESMHRGGFSLVVPRASRVVLDGRRRKGTFGKQTMRGGPRGDLLSAESADDRLFGFGGTDALHGGTGNDLLHGGDADDLLDGGDGDDTVYGEAGDDDIIEARFGNDRLDGGPGDDVIHGRRGTDTIQGGEGDDVIDGGSGMDRVDCGPGEDIVLVNSRREQTANCEEIHQGEGVVYRRCERGGTEEPETVLGSEADDHCSGKGGNDDVEGRGGHDLLEGGSGNDRIFGRFGRDVLRGDDGDDELEGGRGRDRLDGGAGNDQLNGGYHRDRIAGGEGDDRVIARGGGTDRIDCGPGNDIAYVDSRDRTRGCERVKRSGGRSRHR